MNIKDSNGLSPPDLFGVVNIEASLCKNVQQKEDSSSPIESCRILFSVSCNDWRLLYADSKRNGAARILAITQSIVAAILASVVVCLCLRRKKSKPVQKASVSCKSYQLVPNLFFYTNIVFFHNFYRFETRVLFDNDIISI
jgi:hypothetical protein